MRLMDVEWGVHMTLLAKCPGEIRTAVALPASGQSSSGTHSV